MEVVEEVKQEAQAVEQAVAKEAGQVEAAVVGEVKAAVAETQQFTTEARVKISDAEQIVLIRMENEFMKAQMELRRLQDLAKNIQDRFPKMVEELQKKYLIDPATHVYDAIQGAFVKKN